MPKGKKTCPSCEKTNGCRTKTCECGHVFNSKAKQGKKSSKVKQVTHALGLKYIPTPGLWVFDREPGMPAVHAPDQLPPGPLDNQTIYDHCAYNGTGDCMFEYIPSRRIADPQLRKLWKKAHDAMRETWGYLTDGQTTTETRSENTDHASKHTADTPAC